MKKHAVQQELTLFTGNSFSQRQWCERQITKSNDQQSPKDQLEEACWNGFLNELLPEIMEKSSSGKRLFVWHIRHGISMLHIQLSESTVLMDKQYSIDPGFFLPFLLSTN